MSNEKFEDHEEKITKIRQERLNRSLIDACENGDLETVQIVLTSENLDLHADVLGSTGSISKYNLKFPLSVACKEGHLEIVKYLLTSADLNHHADIRQEGYYALFEACMYGHLDIVKYCLTSPELKEHPNINIVGYDNLTLLNEASIRARVDIVKYLLESTELSEHPDIHEDEDFAFKSGLIYKTEEHAELLKYLIFDFKIEKTGNIKNHLKEYPNDEVEKWFEVRDLNRTLENELVSDRINGNKKNKI
jgi:ankyrin repeat protein